MAADAAPPPEDDEDEDAGAAAPSHFAPSLIHCLMDATCAAVSGVPCCGIDGFSSPAMRRYKRLCSALPGTISDPCWPPASAVSRVRRSNFDSCRPSPWQLMQLAAK